MLSHRSLSLVVCRAFISDVICHPSPISEVRFGFRIQMVRIGVFGILYLDQKDEERRWRMCEQQLLSRVSAQFYELAHFVANPQTDGSHGAPIHPSIHRSCHGIFAPNHRNQTEMKQLLMFSVAVYERAKFPKTAPSKRGALTLIQLTTHTKHKRKSVTDTVTHTQISCARRIVERHIIFSSNQCISYISSVLTLVVCQIVHSTAQCRAHIQHFFN